jgi:hypothetical protein
MTMSAWKALLAGAVVGIILIAFRDSESGGWLKPAGLADRLAAPDDEDLEQEPVLGYDGMDQETLIDWLDDSDLDPETLMRTRWYEQRHLAREPVLDALDARL